MEGHTVYVHDKVVRLLELHLVIQEREIINDQVTECLAFKVLQLQWTLRREER